MFKSFLKGSLILLAVMGLTGCVSDKQITEAIKKNPKILFEIIEQNPADFMEAVQKAAKSAQAEMAKRREVDESKKFDEAFDKPLVPEIRKDESVRGTKGGPLVLVEYSDFQCPFCVRGFSTVQQLMKKYPGKVQFIYKHLPLSFHKEALPAAHYYEAIRLQNEKKAFDFHDALFANQRQIAKGAPFFKKTAKKLGVNMKKLAKDVKSKFVIDRVAADMKEAAKFGFQGTPGFLLNGIPVRGAYPVDHFIKIIGKLQEKGKVKL
ncbi:thiol:disulfide interchange protein [Halobacteriovorax marinus]|uniref:Thiol:disulfide interchange protein n=1 Tax=Halobacteriovorax marinus TaxID=97084 RepID=A0A1Y5FAL1_9BACT|nr:thiol:disulfide interchange protein [Halobacteriovorax marinus]